MMVHEKYMIKKGRTGRDGRWDPWQYEAISITADHSESDSAKRGISNRHYSIDSLAQQLATFPGITNAEFVPSLEWPSRLSLHTDHKILTQDAVISSEELGELGILIFEYAYK